MAVSIYDSLTFAVVNVLATILLAMQLGGQRPNDTERRLNNQFHSKLVLVYILSIVHPNELTRSRFWDGEFYHDKFSSSYKGSCLSDLIDADLTDASTKQFTMSLGNDLLTLFPSSKE